MYVTDILDKCADLAARAAAVYRQLAVRFGDDGERVRLWRELALEEETHADVLRRELRSFESDDEAGGFLPDFAERLQSTDRELIDLERRAAAAKKLDDALAIAVALEQRGLEDLYDDLVLQGQPAFRILAERVEAALSTQPILASNAGLPRLFKRPAAK